MEGRKELPVDSVPCFLRGLEVLLVDHDSVSRNYLSLLLEEYSFRVTAIDLASMSQSMISNQKDRFKIVIAKVGMPDMDALSFQHFLLEKDIPVIFITSGGYNDLMKKALAQGSCYFLFEPIQSRDLKYVWQHAYFTKKHFPSNSKGGDKVHKTNITQGNCEEESNEKKRASVNSELISIPSNHHTTNQEGANIIREYNYNSFPGKRSCLWTPTLQSKFTQAATVLGPENVRPKRVLDMINEPYLTLDQVSSHLQKFQSQTKHTQMGFNNHLPQGVQQLNFSTKFPSPFGIHSYLGEWPSAGSRTLKTGSPASAASVNDSQAQYQFPRRFTKTQWQQFLQQQETSGHATFRNELTTGLTNYGSKDLVALAGLPTKVVSVDPYQSMTAFDGNLNPDAAVGTPMGAAKMDKNQSHMGYDHISTPDAIGGNRVSAAAINQNPPQMVHDDPIAALATICDYHVTDSAIKQNQSQNQPQMPYDPISALDAICGKHVPATTNDQNQSQKVYDPISNLDAIFGNHVPAAAIDQNQSHKAFDPISDLDAICGNNVLAAAIDQNQSHKAFDPISNLDAICSNNVPAATIDRNQSHNLYDPISTLDAMCGNHLPTAAIDQNQSQKEHDPITTLDDICGNHVPAASIGQNQSQKLYDPISTLDAMSGNYVPAPTMDRNRSQSAFDDLAILNTAVEGPTQKVQSPIVNDDILSLDTVVGNLVLDATKDQNQFQTVYDDLASPDTVIGRLTQTILSPTPYDVSDNVPAAAMDQNQSQSSYSLYIAQDYDSDDALYQLLQDFKENPRMHVTISP